MSFRNLQNMERVCPGDKNAQDNACVYSGIMENIQVGIVVLDRDSQSVIFINKTATSILDGVVQARDYESLSSVFLRGNGDDKKTCPPHVPQSMRIGERFIGYTIYPISRGYCWIMLQDITDRKIIQEKNSLLAAVVQSAAESIVILDAEGALQYVNPAFEIITGYAKEEVLGKNFCTFKGGMNSKIFCDEMWEAVEAGEPWEKHLVSSKKDGSRYEEEITIKPVKNNQGEVINFVAVMRDVTEKVRLESIAAAVNNMNNIGYVFSGIRHEIGNPVNSIKVALSVLLDNVETFPQQSIRRYIERSLAEILRLEELLSSLKNFNMYEHPVLQAIDAGPFMYKFLELVQEDFRSQGISIRVIFHPETKTMLADPRALKQILLNILTNSADALEGMDEPKIVIHVFQTLQFVVIRIIDNGCGMSEEEQQNMFRPFYTAKDKGTGLGLIIVRKMLTQMSCSIEITSQKGAGTIVDVSVPLIPK